MDDVWRGIAYVLGTKLWVGMWKAHPRVCLSVWACVSILLSRASQGECRAGWSGCWVSNWCDCSHYSCPQRLALPSPVNLCQAFGWLDTELTWPSFGGVMWTNAHSRQMNIHEYTVTYSQEHIHKETQHWHANERHRYAARQRNARAHTHTSTHNLSSKSRNSIWDMVLDSITMMKRESTWQCCWWNSIKQWCERVCECVCVRAVAMSADNVRTYSQSEKWGCWYQVLAHRYTWRPFCLHTSPGMSEWHLIWRLLKLLNMIHSHRNVFLPDLLHKHCMFNWEANGKDLPPNHSDFKHRAMSC